MAPFFFMTHALMVDKCYRRASCLPVAYCSSATWNYEDSFDPADSLATLDLINIR